jgi:hypothetical protein
VSRVRGLIRPGVAVGLAATSLLWAALDGTAAVSARERATVPAKSPKELPGGGKRRILRSDGMTIKVVVYGGSGEIKDDELPVKPHDGNHFTSVKVGLRNMGSTVYRSNLVLASSITNDKGQVFRAVAAGDRGLGKVALKKDQTAYGRIFFELRDDTRIGSFRFRAFGPAGKVSVFVIRGNGGVTKGSTKPLPGGGTRKILRGGGRVIQAVAYGGGGEVADDVLGLKPHSGNHFTSVKFGIKNRGSKAYGVDLTVATKITNTENDLFRSVKGERSGLGKVVLAGGQTVFGRLFFELRDGTRVRSFRFRPFGPTSKVVVFALR